MYFKFTLKRKRKCRYWKKLCQEVQIFIFSEFEMFGEFLYPEGKYLWKKCRAKTMKKVYKKYTLYIWLCD